MKKAELIFSDPEHFFVTLHKDFLQEKSKGLISPPEIPNTCIVEPDIVHWIVGVTSSPSRLYKYKTKKLLSFIAIEGLCRTAKKVREAILVERAESNEALVIVVGALRGTNLRCVAYGRQYSPWLSEMLFRREMVFPVDEESDAISLAKELICLFKHNADKLKEILHFHAYSREEPPKLKIRRSCAKVTWCAKASPVKPVFNSQPDQPGLPLILIGGGGYPCMYTLPHVRGHTRDTLVEYNPIRAKYLGRRFGFKYVETDYQRVLEHVACLVQPSVIIASYDSTHVDVAVAFLTANTGVRLFIEKPPVISYEQFERLLPYIRDEKYFVEIGYNRRYIPMIRKVVSLLKNRQGPAYITCIIREDDMTDSHWNYWASEGTRIHANLCHWIDLGVFLTGCRPIEITCLAGSDFQFFSQVSIRFEDDSIVTLVAGIAGNGLRGVQEYIDIRTDYLTIKIDDFLKMVVYEGGYKRIYRSWPRNKGHVEMYNSFSTACRTKGSPKYGVVDFVRSCVLNEEICQMLRAGEHHRMIDVDQLRTWEQLDG